MARNIINRRIKDFEFDIFPPKADRGKFYGQCLAASWNWLLSHNIDNQTGEMFFLKTSSNYEHKGPYCRIGKHRVRVFSDQAIFVPVIIALADSKHFPHLFTHELRLRDVNYDIDKGDNPPKPNQATIDGEPIVDRSLKDFRVVSPEFSLHVSDKSPLKDELEVPIHFPGTWQAVSAGYCIIIKSLPRRKLPYGIHITARGRDNYLTESFYDIEVVDRKLPQQEQINTHERALETFKKMQVSNEITEQDYERWNDILQREKTETGSKMKGET
jgi:hypothetical protein